MLLDLKILASSSKGNSYLLRAGGETLIIECGVKYKDILKALDFNLRPVVGCVVSHGHKDHSKSMPDVMKSGIDVYASAGTFNMMGLVTQRRGHLLRAMELVNIGKFKVLPFATNHPDAKEPLGFLIKHKEFGKLVFATDTYYLSQKFKGLNYIMIECNYSKEILDYNVKAGNIHPAHAKRLNRSHFRLDRVKECLLANDLSKVREIYLIHLSDGNSDAKLFKVEIEKTTGKPVTIC